MGIENSLAFRESAEVVSIAIVCPVRDHDETKLRVFGDVTLRVGGITAQGNERSRCMESVQVKDCGDKA